MSREIGSPVLPCPLARSSIFVEVARRDGQPLSAPVAVTLRGSAARSGSARGAPARASFAGLDPGRYSIALGCAGDERSFVATADAHEGFDLAARVDRVVFIEIEQEETEVLVASLHVEYEPLPSEADEAEGEGDDSVVISGQLHDEEEEASA